jgi:hypothetical protein
VADTSLKIGSAHVSNRASRDQMAMRCSRRLSWLAGLLLPAAILLSGCEYPDDGGTEEVGVGQGETTTAGCGQPGPQVGRWLPALESSKERQATITTRENPCLPFGQLPGIINTVIPDEEVPDRAKSDVGDFRYHVADVADRFLAYSDAVECGYETDGLAIVIYQHADHPWSVGLVVVVRLSVDAAVDAGLCYLGKQLGFDAPGDSPRSYGNQPRPDFCGLAAQPEGDNGEDYAVVALGSSNWMCEALQASPAELRRFF